MIELPEQLRREDFRFIQLSGKRPVTQRWTTENYTYDDPRALSGSAYGVVCGFGNLVVVDFDDKDVQERCAPKLPLTFSVKTGGKGLLHMYFTLKDGIPDSAKITAGDRTLVDIQGAKRQVVGPGSKHESGRYYEVVQDVPIANISLSELRAAFSDLLVPITQPHDTEKKYIPCPFHHDTQPSLAVYETGTFFCFGCRTFGFVDALNRASDVQFKMMSNGRQAYLQEEELQRYQQLPKVSDEKIFQSAMSRFENYSEMAAHFIKIQPLYYDSSKIWWLWSAENACWMMVDETDILVRVGKAIERGNVINPGVKAVVLEALRQAGRENKPKTPPKSWVQFKNTIVDLSTGERFPASSAYFITNPIPHELGLSTDTPTLDRLFSEWVGEEHVVDLYEITAFCLVTEYSIARIFCFIGSGANGKSTFLNVLTKFLGQNNRCSTELDLLLTSKWELSKLHKKLACMMGETNFDTMKRTSVLKRLCGQDTIGFELKGKDPFDDYNYAKIIIATNSLPMTYDKTDGFYRRWYIVDFPNQFAEKRDILSEIPAVEYENLAAKCITILPVLLSRKNFTNDGSLAERREKYEQKSDPITVFIKNRCTEETNSHTPLKTFVDGFQQFCKEKGYRELNSRGVAQQLRNLGYDVDRHTFDGVNGFHVVGLGIKSITEITQITQFSLTPIGHNASEKSPILGNLGNASDPVRYALYGEQTMLTRPPNPDQLTTSNNGDDK